MSTTPAKSLDQPYQRGLTYFRAGNFGRCLECAEESLASNPRNAASLLLKGMALTELDRADEAIEPLRQAAQVVPENADVWHHLGIALVTGGALEEAVPVFRSVLKLRPDDVPILVDLSNVLFMLGRVAEAIETLEQARQLRQGDLSILRNLAEMYTSAGQPGSALQVLEAILELQPTDILAYCDAAWLYFRAGRLDEAAEAYRALRRLDPDQEHELYAIHGLVLTEIRRQNWRDALDLAIEATRLDRFEMTTSLLTFISGKLFGKAQGVISEAELEERFEAEHCEHRRLHAELVTVDGSGE